jgi:hypothetical protein
MYCGYSIIHKREIDEVILIKPINTAYTRNLHNQSSYTYKRNCECKGIYLLVMLILSTRYATIFVTRNRYHRGINHQGITCCPCCHPTTATVGLRGRLNLQDPLRWARPPRTDQCSSAHQRAPAARSSATRARAMPSSRKRCKAGTREKVLLSQPSQMVPLLMSSPTSKPVQSSASCHLLDATLLCERHGCRRRRRQNSPAGRRGLAVRGTTLRRSRRRPWPLPRWGTCRASAGP